MKAYLAGPDVFLPNAPANAAAKIAICAKYGIQGRAPLDDDADGQTNLTDDRAWRAIYEKCLGMMQECDIIIANLTPFRSTSADSGTLIEAGWFLGRGKPVFGYSNTVTVFAERSLYHLSNFPDPMPGLALEGFGLPDNLMIAGAVEYGGGLALTLPEDGVNRAFDALDVFEKCVAAAAQKLRSEAGL